MSLESQTDCEGRDLSKYSVPSNLCLQHAAKLSIVDDRPVLLDYWVGSCDKEVFIGVRETDEKLLVRSEDEYTSPIVKIFKVDAEFIVMTENSIYVVKNDISTKRIS